MMRKNLVLLLIVLNSLLSSLFVVKGFAVNSARTSHSVLYSQTEERRESLPTTNSPIPPVSSDDEEKERPEFPWGKIWDRTLDTLEDAIIHVRRIPYDLGWTSDDVQNKPTIVVLGSGWASHALMKITDTFEYRLIIISPMNHFVFTPMLASAAVGTVEYRSMTEAVRSANPMATYIEGKAMDVDLDRKTVRVQLANLLQDTRTGDPPLVDIAYDQLVVAVGCKVADNLVPGASKYCMRLKTCDDARRLRNAVGECLEYALRPDSVDMPNLAESESERRQEERRRRATFCIVGGGPTGVELAGELSDFFRQVTKPRVGSYESLKDDIKLVLVEGSGFLLPPFDPVLRAEALKTLLKAGVDVRLNTFVKEVGDGYIKLNPRGTDQEEVLEAGVIVWAAGTGPVPFVEKLLEKLPDEAKGRPGRINVDPWLRCPTPSRESFGSILVMGDAAAFQDEKQSFLPQTAQVAGQQGAFAARLLCRGYDLTVTPPILKADDKSPLATWMKIRGLQEAAGFQFLNLGILAYLGGGEALSQIQIGDFPVLSYAGSISFALWRSVYLVKQVATRNRVLVTLDWFKSAIFGRDITRL